MTSRDKLIHCGICRKVYDDPRLLPCSHTFCLNCIKRTAATYNDEFECPHGDGTRVTKCFFDTLPVNRTISDVIEYLDLSSGNIRCSNCHCSSAGYWCQDCDKQYCTRCLDDIHSLPAFRDHRVMSLGRKPTELIPCDRHVDEKLKYWCLKCHTFVCSDCLLYAHKNHSFTPMSQIAGELENRVDNDLEHIEASLSTKKKEVEQSQKKAQKDHQTNKERLSDAMNFFRKAIDEHEKETLDQIEGIENNEKQSFVAHQIQLHNEYDSLKLQKEIFQILIQSEDQMKLLRARQAFLHYINRTNRVLQRLQLSDRQSYDLQNSLDIQGPRESIIECCRFVEKVPESEEERAPRYPELEKLLASYKTQTEWNFERRNLSGEAMKLITDAIGSNTTVQKLYLSENQLDDQGMHYLCDALRKNTTLTTLDLRNNPIDDYKMQYLADALAHNRTLTTLDLCQNEIDDRGVQHLALMLLRNHSIRVLHLSQNQIGDRGAQYVADVLQKNRTLTILHLSHNQIGDRGVRYLAGALAQNSTLTVLNLYWNDISDPGAKSLADALEENQTLTTLYLSQNRIGDTGAQQLGNALRRNKTLTALSLHQNHIGHQTQAQVNGVLKNNKIQW